MKFKTIFFLLILFSICYSSVNAAVSLPKLISDGMVLQRDAQLKLWGWANPYEKVTLTLAGKNYATQANAQGEWTLKLKKHKAGGPYEMTIKGENEIILKNIVFGDVWLCSGQSNMELPVKRVLPLYKDEIAQAANPFIRTFTVPQKYNFKYAESDFTSGHWQELNQSSVLDFSAVAYFFAQELYREKKIPIGLINASLGGSPVQAWMSENALKQFPKHLNEAYRWRNDALIRDTETNDRQRAQNWYQLSTQQDIGQKGCFKIPEIDDSDWLDFEIPGYWAEEQQAQNGVFWFRREIQLTDSQAGQPAFLNMGRIVDADSVFINGHFVGNITYQYPPRWYDVPANILKSGRNVIAVRVVSNSGRGGFVPDKPYYLEVAGKRIALTGKWKMKQSCEMPALAGETFVRWQPMGLFNAMIAPLSKYGIKGVIWYQGESNTSNPEEYAHLFPAMIQDWRSQLQQRNIPFLFVQLANFMEAKAEPAESQWAETRQAQRAALALRLTGMVVTIDIGEWNDIHPLDKKNVGARLALAARKLAYKERKIVSSGPEIKSVRVKAKELIVSFKELGSGLPADEHELSEFAVAGADGRFVWAKATVRGNQLIVAVPDEISKPKILRYAWADNPQHAKLRNKEGLPASPFEVKLP